MKIVLLGDVGLFGKFCIRNGLKPESYFSDFIDKTKSCDFVIGNLETPFTKSFKEHSAKSAYIGSFEENIEAIKALGISHVNLANNHTGDFGIEGYSLTKKVLDDNGIKYFGIEARKEFLDFDGNRICFSGFCNMDSNPVFLSDPEKINDLGVNIADADKIIEGLSNSSDLGYLNILAFHSGLEHVNLPGRADICFARYLAQHFDYVLYGHHPHVVQAYEKVNKSHLFYSLGNFCFDDVYSNVSKKPLVKMTEDNKLGLAPILTIENNIIENVEYLWTYLGAEKMEILENDNFEIIKTIKNLDLSDLDKVERERNEFLSKWLTARKGSRDLNWYLKRLRVRYIKLLFNSKKNRKLYEKHYLNKLKNINII